MFQILFQLTHFIYIYIQIGSVTKPISYEEAAELLSTGKRDIRIEILVDLLALSMNLNKQPTS